MACAPSKDSDQPGHPPSLISVFAVCMKKAWILRYPWSAQRRLWSDWTDVQANLSLRWPYSHFVGFVMRWLTWNCNLSPTTELSYGPQLGIKLKLKVKCVYSKEIIFKKKNCIFKYWNTLKTQHLIQCQFLPEDQNQNVLAYGYPDVAEILE